MRGSGAGCAVAFPATLALAPAAPAHAEVTCAAAPPASQQTTGVPWPQTRYDLHRLASVVTGVGITVAVIDSGVDAGHPQLAGVVVRGEDLLTPGGTGM